MWRHLEDVGELGVAVRNMALLGRGRRDHVAQRRERLVDVLRLLQPVRPEQFSTANVDRSEPAPSTFDDVSQG